MPTIWKYQVKTCEAMIEMPAEARIVHFAHRDGRPTFWAIVNQDAPMVKRHFYLAGTGEPLPIEFNTHRGTCFDGPYVWHLFENTIPGIN